MSKLTILVARTGEFNGNFGRSVVSPIENEEFSSIRWGIDKSGLTNVKQYNILIEQGIDTYVLLVPSAPHNSPYAICKLKEIKERNLGPLIPVDETNEEIEWFDETSSGNNTFEYMFIFSEIYLLKKDTFEGEKVNGQHKFFELKEIKKNGELTGNFKLYRKVIAELPYIIRYVEPIRLN